MGQLIERIFYAAFGNPLLETRADSALLPENKFKRAFTTDSYVVRPLIFPGGDIGALAVNGTVNDLAMVGARPEYLSAAFILEEGLALETLWAVVQSMKKAVTEANVQIVTGDTKVVDRGKADGLYITTTGIGVLEHDAVISPKMAQVGDAIILSGDVGRHGMAVMAVREGLQFESEIKSDCAPLSAPVLDLLEHGIMPHCQRDITRGGLASALVEIATTANLSLEIREMDIPIREDVQGACEILGFDPLYVACEGRFVTFVPEGQVDKALERLRGHSVCRDAVVIGKVEGSSKGRVTLRNRIGTSRVLDLLTGDQLPRIC